MTNELLLHIIQVLWYEGGREWNYCETLHPFDTIYFIFGGDGHIRVRDKVIDLAAGNAYLIPTGLLHDIWCDSYIKKVYAEFHVELVPGYDVFSGTTEIRSLPVGMARVSRIQALLGGGLRERLALRGELCLLVADFLEREPKPLSPKVSSLLPILNEIQNHLSASLRRDDIALRFGWNPSVLSRTFTQVFGCSFKQYTENLLSARLTEELLLTDKTLTQLAAEYGFCDSYYLSSFFKRRLGVSPTAYRRLYQRSNGHV